MILVVLFGAIPALAQEPAEYRHLFRFYEDNDFINLFGQPTDKGYTNGTRLDYFFVKEGRPRFFLDRWMPKAGKASVNTCGWSLMHIMITPDDLTKTIPEKNDWPYSGALVAAHTLHSINPATNTGLETELVAGIMGPPALAHPLQQFMHSVLGVDKPLGWDEQLPTDILLNLNVTVETALWQPASFLDWAVGAKAMAGTMMNGMTVYTQIRLGKMRPYFTDYFSRYRSEPGKGSWQLYVLAKPALNWTLHNSLIEGGVFSGKGGYYAGADSTGSIVPAKKITAGLDVGALLAGPRLSISFTQKTMTPVLKSIRHHTTGNISVTYSW